MFNKLKYKILTRLLCELCVKSGCCRVCYARFDSDVETKPLPKYLCPHGYIYDQAERVWSIKDSANPLERENS